MKQKVEVKIKFIYCSNCNKETIHKVIEGVKELDVCMPCSLIESENRIKEVVKG